MAGVYYGVYKGVVIMNDDPEGSLRCKVRVPGVYPDDALPEELPWAELVVGPGLSTSGGYRRPDVTQEVLVQFLAGSPAKPVITGAWLRASDPPNASRIDYTAGDDTKVIEGRHVQVSRGDQLQLTNRDLKQVCQGAHTLRARRSTVEIAGVLQTRCQAQESVVGGDCGVQVEGKTTLDLMDDLRVGVAGFVSVGSVLPVDVVSFGGVNVKGAFSTVSLKSLGASATGLYGVELAVTDPTGLVPISQIGLNVAQIAMLAPVITATSLGAIDFSAAATMSLAAGAALNMVGGASVSMTSGGNMAFISAGPVQVLAPNLSVGPAPTPVALSVPVEARLVALEAFCVLVAAALGIPFAPPAAPTASPVLLA